MTASITAFAPVSSPIAFRLPLSARAPLVKLDTVIAARGENAHVIEKFVEEGRLRWVFNVAVKAHGMRDLRFWSREVSAFAASQRDELAAIHGADLRAVVNEILGDRRQFSSGDMCLLLGVRRATLMRLRGALLAPCGHLFPRAGLESFLKRRLVQ